MNKLLDVIIKFSRALKSEDRKLFFETIVHIILMSAEGIRNKNTEAFREFKDSLDNLQKVDIVNIPKIQEIEGDVKLKNVPKVTGAEVDIKGVSITNKKTPKDYVAVRFTDGKKLINL